MNIKKTLYNATHRGMKEMDVLLGRFALDRLASLAPHEHEIFDDLLDELDADILSWCMGQVAPPRKYELLIKQILTTKI